MGESLWADLDQWQVDHLKSKLGPDSAYETLVAQMVVATAIRDYHEWDNADVWSFPAVIVSSAKAIRAPMGIQHMDGKVHFRKSYPYTWLAVVEGDSFTAEALAKTMEKRLETVAIEILANGWGAGATISIAPDGSGEKLTTISIGGSHTTRFRRASIGDSDPWYGVCSLDIDIITTV